MADRKITELDAAVSALDTDLVAIARTVPVGNKKTTLLQVLDLLRGKVLNTFTGSLKIGKSLIISIGANVVSASTLSMPTDGNTHTVTGAIGITSLGSGSDGEIKILRFAEVLTITHNATSLQLPGGVNFTTKDGDVLVFQRETGAPDNWYSVSAQSNVPSSIGFSDLDTDLGDTTKLVNGSYLDEFTFVISSDGATVTGTFDSVSGNDVRVLFDDGVQIIDTDPTAKTVTLTPGSDTSPTRNFIYILHSTNAVTSNTTGFPDTVEISHIADVLVQSAASVQTFGVYKTHKHNDHLKKGTGGLNGHLSNINHWIRHQRATHSEGVDQTLTITPGAPDTVIFTTSSGVILQLHDHTFPAFSGTPDIYVVNDSTTPFDRVTDLSSLLTDSEGVSMSASRFSLVIWGVVSEDTGDCKLFCNLPAGSYNSDSAVIADDSKFANYSIPEEFTGVGFLISELKLRHQTSGGGTWTSVQEIDLRGLSPSLSAGAGTAKSSEFVDNVFSVEDVADSTKKFVWDVGTNVPTGTTVTIKAPSADLDLDAIGGGGGAWSETLTARSGLTEQGAAPNENFFITTSFEVAVLSFDDTLVERAKGEFPLPDDYDGGAITFDFYWVPQTHTGTDAVRLQIRSIIYKAGDDLGAFSVSTSFITASHAGGADVMNKSSFTITPDGASAGADRLCHFVISRIASDGADTMTGDMDLLSMKAHQ